MLCTQPRVLLSTVSSDSHTWNLVYLQLLLSEHGYDVHNLGATVPDDLLVRTAVRTRPDAIVISTVNGHGFLDGRRVIGHIRDRPELSATPVVIGGKLGVAGADGDHLDQLRSAGFDAAFHDADAGALLDSLGALVPSSVAGERTGAVAA